MQIIIESLRMLFESVPFLIGCVTRGSAFPKPLPPEEEREYLARMAKGDREARDKLVEHNLRLVAHVARKYRRRLFDMDDLISVGTVGLIKAVNSYDPGKGRPLASFAARCIENAILSGGAYFPRQFSPPCGGRQQ